MIDHAKSDDAFTNTAIDGAPPPQRECLRCGYDLRGLGESRVCPECGLEFDPDAPPPPAVPWVARRTIGHFIAYVRTVWLVVFRSREFARQAWKWSAIDPADSESFRRVTVAIATTSAAWTAGTLQLHDPNRVGPGVGAVMMLAAACAGAFFWIATARVRIPMPHGRASGAEERFAYLQKFCCAGLALSPIVPIVATGMTAAAAVGPYNDPPALWIVAFFASVGVVLILWCGGCGAYLIMGGRVSLRLIVQAVYMSVALWFLAAVGAIIAGLAAMAVINVFNPIGR